MLSAFYVSHFLIYCNVKVLNYYAFGKNILSLRRDQVGFNTHLSFKILLGNKAQNCRKLIIVFKFSYLITNQG